MESVAIIGSRKFSDNDQVVRFVAKLAAKYPGCRVVSGAAQGPDSYAALTARNYGLSTLEYIPTKLESGRYGITVWSRNANGETKEKFLTGTLYPSYGAAAYARNQMIVKAAQVVVAFWDGESKGTKNSLDIAKAFNRQSFVYRPR
ncbi:MAG TPA: DNA-processing protein DprA [Gemmatimonadales bacterium]|nr:DNA-processing protein DprA [Gemmatimonadales bacterium]